MNTPQISFEKASIKHQDMIFKWLAEPHMQEFWDNSQEHKDDLQFHVLSFSEFKFSTIPFESFAAARKPAAALRSPTEDVCISVCLGYCYTT